MVSNEVSDSYFKSRPRGSQIGAWSSNQSHELISRKELTDNILEIEKKFKTKIYQDLIIGMDI